MSSVNLQDFGYQRTGRAVGRILLAPFTLIRAIFRAAFHVGFFVYFTGPIMAYGLASLGIAIVLIGAIGYGVYDYNTNPTRELQSKRMALAWAQQTNRERDAERRRMGQPPLTAEERRTGTLERQITELQAKINASQTRAAAQASTSATSR